MKLLVIGNSHTAMLATAMQNGEAADHQVDFFACAGEGPVEVEFDGSRVKAIGSDLKNALRVLGMREEFDLHDYDGVAIVAMSANLFSIIGIPYKHRILDWSLQTVRPQAVWRDPISEDLVSHVLQYKTDTCLAQKYLQFIRKSSNVKTAIIAQPSPSEKIITQAKWQTFVRAVEVKECHLLQAALEKFQRSHFEKFENTTYVAQPLKSLTADGLTQQNYVRGARRLNIDFSQKENDVLHANADYGALVFQHLMPIFESTKG